MFAICLVSSVTSLPTYHYVRSNMDGTLPEHIVFRPAGTHSLEVFKYVQPGTQSALVSCTMTPDLKSPMHLVSWVLQGQAKKLMATLDYDGDAGYASVFVKPSGSPAESVLLPDASWHIFNMDLASVALTLAGAKGRAVSFSFVEPNARGFTPAMVTLGTFTLSATGEDTHKGYRCDTWVLKGEALRGKKGTIWMSKQGFLVEAVVPLPNHEGYKDFRMVLKRTETTTDSEWTSFVRRTVAGSKRR